MATATPISSAKQPKPKSIDDAAIDTINAKLGAGTIMKMGKAEIPAVPVLSTGSVTLDRALGVGGLPLGRIVEAYGQESGGKTTLCLHVIANAQKAGMRVAFIDAEHALDLAYARNLGVDVSSLLVSQPDFGEQALDVLQMLIQSKAVGVIVVDSVAALTPKAEIDGEAGDFHVGVHARMMSQALRRVTALCNTNNVMVIFTNQIRMKIGVKWGSPETTTGGNALKFYASVRLDVRRIGSVKQGEQVIGNRTRIKVVKNKLAPPFKEAEFDLMYGAGFSREGEIVELGVELGLVEKNGSWFSVAGAERLGQGLEGAKAALRERPELREKLAGAILAHQGPVPKKVEKVADDDGDFR